MLLASVINFNFFLLKLHIFFSIYIFFKKNPSSLKKKRFSQHLYTRCAGLNFNLGGGGGGFFSFPIRLLLLSSSSMDHGPELSYQSGLERDRRQDEARAKYPGREDDEFPTAYDMSQASQDLPSHMPITEIRSRVCGLRVSTFLLLATVIVLLALAGVGMGILGSRIKSGRNDSAGQNRCVRYYIE